jgi:hypothetical protein
LKYGLIFVAEETLECLNDDGGQRLSSLFAARAELSGEHRR